MSILENDAMNDSFNKMKADIDHCIANYNNRLITCFTNIQKYVNKIPKYIEYKNININNTHITFVCDWILEQFNNCMPKIVHELDDCISIIRKIILMLDKNKNHHLSLVCIQLYIKGIYLNYKEWKVHNECIQNEYDKNEMIAWIVMWEDNWSYLMQLRNQFFETFIQTMYLLLSSYAQFYHIFNQHIINKVSIEFLNSIRCLFIDKLKILLCMAEDCYILSRCIFN